MAKFYIFSKFMIVTLVLILTSVINNAQVIDWEQIGVDIDGTTAGDLSGNAVSMSSDGSVVAIGAYAYKSTALDPQHWVGQVRIFKNQSGTWTQLGADIYGEAAEDISGRSVSLNSDGTVVAIGAYWNGGNGAKAGQVRVYNYQAGSWVQVGADIDGEAAGDESGNSVSISSDGTIVAIGAPGNDNVNGADAGHVRVYKNLSGTWTQIGTDIDGKVAGDFFGFSVSLSADGSIVAVGANKAGSSAGQVSVYKNLSGTWTQIGADVNGEAAGDESGYKVDLSSDGNVVAVGAYLNDVGGTKADAGHVRVYRNISGTWTQIGADIDGEVAGDRLGRFGVSINSDGSIVAVGAYLNDGGVSDAGNVRVFRNQSGSWVQIGTNINGEAAGDYSGYSVSLSSNGLVVGIGAIQNDGANGANSGHVRVYSYNDCAISEVINPIAICKDIVVYLEHNGQTSIQANELDGGSTDNCGIDHFTASKTNFNCDDIGTVNVTLTAYDKSDNYSSCTSVVTVSDLISPVAVCKDVLVSLDNGVSASITAADIDGGSTDNCGIVSTTISKSDFTIADLGTNTVKLTVWDGTGYLSSCEAVVTVGDTLAPDIKCNPLDIVLDTNGTYELTAADILMLSEGTTDNIDDHVNLTVTASPVSFNCESIGVDTTIILTAEDASGNVSTCTASITVMDTTSLKIDSVENILVELELGVCETQITYPEITTSNACAVISQVSGLGADGLFPIGTTTESWMATNLSGDTVEISFDVVVTSLNAAPTVDSLVNVMVDEGVGTVEVSLSGISYGMDCESQIVELSATGINAELVTSIVVDYTSPDSTGMLSLTVAPEMSGTDTISVWVSDGIDNVSVAFVLEVVHVNHAPAVVNATGDKSVNASYVIKIPVSTVFEDVDGDMLTYDVRVDGIAELPVWLTFENDTIVAAPAIADTSCVEVILMATDPDGEMAADTFQLCADGYPTASIDVEVSAFNVQMYPNPAKGEVTLKINASEIMDSEVVVQSITGSEVYRKKFKAAEKIKFDLSEQVSGIYLVTLKQGKNSVVKKLILDRK